jgi:hypothetical protein
MQRRLAASQLVAGVCIALFSGIAQFSSLPTPYFARYPQVLVLLGSGGVFLLCLAALACIVYACVRHSSTWIVAGGTYLVLAGLARSVPILTVFQLSLAGLTVGGGLVLLACTNFIRL